MFVVYKSNTLNMLLLKAYRIIKEKPLSNIFEKEIFIHDSKVLFQYLNIFLAEKIGISANLKLYHPNEFIWKLFQIILSKKELKNKFTHSMMIWKIMKVLDKKNSFKYHDNIKNKIKNFKFSFLMANIFEKYIFYRPNWINSWEKEKNISTNNEDEKWQRKLWIEIINNEKQIDPSSNHFSNLLHSFEQLIKEKKIKKKHLPKRCFIISSFALNPAYINIFKKISTYIDIYFLYITPCKNNIFDIIQNNKSLSKEIIKKRGVLNGFLITLWGKYEKIYSLYILNTEKIKLINCFEENKKNDLLNHIKNDFFKKNILRINKIKKRLLKFTDNSIFINICYNKKNEIEILHEKLLVLFHDNPSIKPGDVVVTSYSIESYIPCINLIFKSVDNNKQIPFFISRKFSKKTEIILSCFKKILSLSQSRFKNEEILELLDIPEIAKKFNILEEEIKILYNWIDETNIRWAMDCKHKNYLSFPQNKQNTWFYGIEKLLLSYAMNDTKKIWNNILSCSLINGSRADLIGKLIIFIKILKKWQKKLSKSQYLIYWRLIAEDLINDFFYYSKKIEKSVETIKKQWIKMIDDGISSNYLKKISIEILKKNFFYKFHHSNNEVFFPGVVNFCHLNSISYIPFKMIYIIGADHLSTPKINHVDNFNLLKKYPLIGDINNYQRHCYLFLQSISCAEEYFHISYVGYSMKDESKIYPSVLVDQLLNYISLNFYLIGDENLNLEDNTKKITKHLCRKYKKQYFYEKKNINSSIKEKLQNIFQHINVNLCDKNISKTNGFNKIDLKDLINFWKNPIRYFFNFNLKIKFNTQKKIIDTTEPFLVNKLDAFKIKNTLLDAIIDNQDTKKLFQYYMLSGKLPYNFFGKIFWNKKIQEMKKIAQEVVKYKILTEVKKINLTVYKYQINGILSEIQSTGLLRWKSGKINFSDRISLWLEHLIYSISGGFGESKIIGYKGQNWSFSSLNSDIACIYLKQYIEGYIKGRKKILFLTQSGAAWLDQVYDIRNNFIKNDDDTIKKGYKKLLESWTGNNYIKGEKEDFYIKKTIPQLNENNIKKICATAQKFLIPILKNKKISTKK